MLMTEGAFRLFTERLGLQESTDHGHFKRTDELVAAKMRASRWLSGVLMTVWEGLTSSPGYEEHILGALERGELDGDATPEPETVNELRRVWNSVLNKIKRIGGGFKRIQAEGGFRVVTIEFVPALIPELDDYITLAAEEDEYSNEDQIFKIVFHLWTEKEREAQGFQSANQLHLYLNDLLPAGSQGLRELISSANHELHHLARSKKGAHSKKNLCGSVFQKLESLSDSNFELLPKVVKDVATYLGTEIEISAHAMQAAMWISDHGGEVKPNTSVSELLKMVHGMLKYEEGEHGRVPTVLVHAMEFLTLAHPRRMENEYRSEMTPTGRQLLKRLGLDDEEIIECCAKVADAYADRLSSYFQAVERNRR